MYCLKKISHICNIEEAFDIINRNSEESDIYINIDNVLSFLKLVTVIYNNNPALRTNLAISMKKYIHRDNIFNDLINEIYERSMDVVGHIYIITKDKLDIIESTKISQLDYELFMNSKDKIKKLLLIDTNDIMNDTNETHVIILKVI